MNYEELFVMVEPVGYYLGKLKRDGLPAILRRRVRWYWYVINSFRQRIPSFLAHSIRQASGRIVEWTGNRVRIEGAVFSTDNPLIQRSQKGEMLFAWHEAEERRMVKRWLRTDLPIVEFGGGLGVISCLANRRLTRPEDHVVVEANPGIVPLLERNRDLNGCRFRVINKALAYGSEVVEFGINPRFTASRVGGPGATVAVSATSLETIADDAGFDQISLICDVEGAEVMLVEREIDTLRRRVQLLLIEIHQRTIGEEETSRLTQALENSGFVLRDRYGINWVFTREFRPLTQTP
jgi:FkbM family methyltransferase